MNTHILIPLWTTVPNSYARLQELMLDPKTILVEARATPLTTRQSEWCWWELQRVWDPRYYYFSDRSYGGGGSSENWLGNRHDERLKSGIELINAEMGIRFLQIGVVQGRPTVLLCTHKGKKNEQCHWKVIVELLKLRVPDLQVIL